MSAYSRPDELSGIIEAALRSPGRPLGRAVRREMEEQIRGDITAIPADASARWTVRAVGDAYELEAERIAEQTVARRPRRGRRHDFKAVRIHTGEAAAEAARLLDARAFTVGRHIVFGKGQYRPDSDDGRRLLAHELAHVCQQGRGNRRVVQRAEIDTADPRNLLRARLIDCLSDINGHVNATIDKVRLAAPKNIQNANQVKWDIIRAIKSDHADDSKIGYTKIERWAENLGLAKVGKRPKNASKYQNVQFGLWWKLNPKTGGDVISGTIKVNGVLIGTDKLGHFFQQGLMYFGNAHRQQSGANGTRSEADKGALMDGWYMETGPLGMGKYSGEVDVPGLGKVQKLIGDSTGVYSRADLAANWAGYQFYKEVLSCPDIMKFKFDIARYLTPLWNEEVNPNLYVDEVGRSVWNTLLAGRQGTTIWRGRFSTEAGGRSGHIDVAAQLAVANDKIVSGFISHIDGGGRTSAVTQIVNGRITYLTDRPTGIATAQNDPGPETYLGSVITGIRIEFDWLVSDPQFGTTPKAGRGQLVTIDEQHLVGKIWEGKATQAGGTLYLSADGSPAPVGWLIPVLAGTYDTWLTPEFVRRVREQFAASR